MKVFIIAALTADGYIAQHSDHLAAPMSREDRQLFVRLTKEAGVIAVGSRTFATFASLGRTLPGRTKIVYTSQPQAISAADDVQTTDEPPAALVARLQKSGAAGLAVCGGRMIYDLFMQAGVVDELYLTIEPVLFGTGLTLFSQELSTSLELMETIPLNTQSICQHYRVIQTT